MLATLFPEVPEGRLLLIWANKISTWCRSLDEAHEWATAFDKMKQDVYFGVGLVDEAALDARVPKLGDRRHIRGRVEEIREVPGLWLDLDWKEGWTENSAAEWVERVLKPTVLVRTGHGHHCYWLFPKPQRVQRDSCQGFQRWLETQTDMHLDATGDLARILRVPGTHNYKGEPLPVEVVYDDGPRYDLSELPHLEAVTSRWASNLTPDSRIPNGARNESLTSVLGYMGRRGLNQEQLDSFALWWNENVNAEPEPTGSVLRTSQSVGRYQ